VKYLQDLQVHHSCLDARFIMTTTALLLAAALTVAFVALSSAASRPDFCLLNPDKGSCDLGYFTSWYYDQNEGMCKRSDWRGCGGGKENNFDTLLQCQQTCQFACQVLPDTVPKDNLDVFTAWYYDSSTGECAQTSYPVAEPSARNKFSSKELCENACKPGVKQFKCPERNCQNTCDFGYQVDSVGCPMCRCKLNPNQSACRRQNCSTEIPCYDGYKVDSSGCFTCECSNCGPVCLIGCFYNIESIEVSIPLGLKEDENGCAYCKCQSLEDLCGVMKCGLKCPTGYEKDKNGCDLCECVMVK